MPIIRRLGPDDRPVLEAFLNHHRVSSMFLRSNLFHGGIEDGPERYQGTYVGAFEGDVLTDVAAHYWNNNIILQAPTAPVALAVAAAKDSGRIINGVLGPWSQVKEAELELDMDRSRLGKVVPEFLYALDLRNLSLPVALTSGTVSHRYAVFDDLLILVPWRRVYDRITMGFPEHTINDVRNHDMLRDAIEDQRLWVLEEKDELVAMTGFNATLPDTVQVGGVYTAEERRGCGHARSAVAGSLLDARAVGVTDAILFTEMDNYPAQKAYEALGFVKVGDYGMVVLDPV